MPNFKDQFEQAISQLEPQPLQADYKGIAVYNLQLALAELGIYASTIDGYLGRETVAAVQQFQPQQGLAATGLFNVETWHALAFWAK